MTRRLTEIRAESSLFLEESFPSILGSGAQSAIIHYNCMESAEKVIDYSEVILLDSGGHFLNGTTDITRTFRVAPSPNPRLSTCYTYVLKGNLQLERQHFPAKTTTGAHLDILARQFLYQAGLDYGHGTGHGIGYASVVHEPPVSISKLSKVPLAKGMLLSNEPGYYLPGQFGIRIENNLEVVESDLQEGFLTFQNHTLVPYDRTLIEKDLLSPQEVTQINLYHQTVRKVLGEQLRQNGHHQEHSFLLSITEDIRDFNY